MDLPRGVTFRGKDPSVIAKRRTFEAAPDEKNLAHLQCLPISHYNLILRLTSRVDHTFSVAS